MNFAHVALQVKNLEKSLSLYEGVLGLPVLRRGEGEMGPVFLGEQGQPLLELIGGVQEPVFSGFFIGFNVPNLEEATKKMEEVGYSKTRGPISPNPQIEFSFFRGPDGEEIQLVGSKV